MYVAPGLMTFTRMPAWPQAAAETGRCEHQGRVGRASREDGSAKRSSPRSDDVDDRTGAAGRHPRQNPVHDIHVGEELRVHRRPPLVRREFVRRPAPGTAGGVDQHGDRPDLPLAVRHDPLGGSAVRQIRRERRRGDAFRRQCGVGGIQVFLAAGDDDHARTFAPEDAGAGQADPPCCRR